VLPVGFALIFGNENGASWKEFWRFIARMHPSKNRGDVTLITDQDKGSMGAIKEVMPSVGHFFCSWHRCKNTIKHHGGASGRVPFSPLWVYNKLVECRLVEHFNKVHDQYFTLMESRDLQYLNNILEHAQYPVMRCKQGPYMYHRQTSQDSEVMNVANIDIYAQTAVCLVNAAMLTIKMECNHDRMQQTSAWALNNELTPRGEQEYMEIFDGLNYRDFMTNVVDCGAKGWECSVARQLVSATQKNMVIIPKEPTEGSYFGKCTCRLDKRDAIPCGHMAVVVVSSRIGVLT